MESRASMDVSRDNALVTLLVLTMGILADCGPLAALVAYMLWWQQAQVAIETFWREYEST
jgi:hypothetical protein